MWLLVFGLTLPKGIGPSVIGNSIDITKLLLLSAAFLSFRPQFHGRFKLKRHTFYLLGIIFLILGFSISWINTTQYLIFFYYLFMYISALWVAEFLFRDVTFYCRFTNYLGIALIVSGIMALLDHQLSFIPFHYLRAENEAFIHQYSRGAVFGNIELAAYKGFDSVPAWFAMERFTWLAWGALSYLFHLRNPKLGLNPRILIAASVLGALEIILCQSRVTTFLALALFLYILVLLFAHHRANKAHAMGILSLLFLLLVLGSNYALVFLKNIYSVFNFLHIGALESDLVYQFDVDKRGQALTAIAAHFFDHEAYLPPGPLFYNYQDWFLNVPSEYFDDVTPIITSIFEFGAVPWLFLVAFIIHIIRKKKDSLGQMFVGVLFLVGISSIGCFSPRFYYLIFFTLGAILARTSVPKRTLKNSIIENRFTGLNV